MWKGTAGTETGLALQEACKGLLRVCVELIQGLGITKPLKKFKCHSQQLGKQQWKA